MKRIVLVVLCIALLFCGCAGGAEEVSSVETVIADSSSSIPEIPDVVYDGVYNDIIAGYKDLVNFRLSNDFDEEWTDKTDRFGKALNTVFEQTDAEWGFMLIELLGYPHAKNVSDFGYKLYDINDDGTDELFWVRKDGFILAIFTEHKGKIQMLDAYWSRYKAVVTDNNEIFTMGSSGAAYTDFEKHILSDGKLVFKEASGTDGYDEETQKTIYYKTENGVKTIIKEEDGDKVYDRHPVENGDKWLSQKITYLK